MWPRCDEAAHTEAAVRQARQGDSAALVRAEPHTWIAFPECGSGRIAGGL